MITTTRETDYMLNRIEGNVTIRELLEYAQCNVDIWLTEPVLWDLRNATLTEDKSDYAARPCSRPVLQDRLSKLVVI